MKPLGHKAYGSIPHLPGSKRGPGDHGLEERQAVLLTEKASRDWTIVVQEKLDGSCMSVAKINGEIVALGRAGFVAESSPYEHLRLFAPWVAARRDRFDALLEEGERVVGEWLLLATALRYFVIRPDDLFHAFDIMRLHDRALPDVVKSRCREAQIATVPMLHSGSPMPPEQAWLLACNTRERQQIQCEDWPEGVVYRAIRNGRVSFIAKWVRSNFEAGRYLDHAVYNFPPHRLRASEAA